MEVIHSPCWSDVLMVSGVSILNFSALSLAPAPDRPICHEVQPQVTSICVSGTGLPSCSSDCPGAVVTRGTTGSFTFKVSFVCVGTVLRWPLAGRDENEAERPFPFLYCLFPIVFHAGLSGRASLLPLLLRTFIRVVPTLAMTRSRMTFRFKLSYVFLCSFDGGIWEKS